MKRSTGADWFMHTCMVSGILSGQFVHGMDPAPRTKRQCRLPGCTNTTTHNGGYCCADHCRQHHAEKGGAK